MCSWLCTTDEGRLVLASPDLTYLDSIAACAVGHLLDEREHLMPFPTWICMQQSLCWHAVDNSELKRKHPLLTKSCGFFPQGVSNALLQLASSSAQPVIWPCMPRDSWVKPVITGLPAFWGALVVPATMLLQAMPISVRRNNLRCQLPFVLHRLLWRQQTGQQNLL